MTATEQPVLDRLTVLASGGEHGVAWTAGQRGDKAVDTGNELRKYRPAGGKETIRAALAIKEGETRFNVRNAVDFKDRFGSGKKKLTEMAPAERANSLRAKELIERNAKIALFLEARALDPGKRDDYVKEGMIKSAIGERTTMTFRQLRQEALQSIIDHPSFVSMFPEINAHTPPLNPGQKVDFIEKTLMPAEDERFASRLGARMHEAYKEAVGFESVASDEKGDEIDQNLKIENGKLDLRVKAIRGFLNGRGIDNPATRAAFTDAEIANIIKTGALTPESATDALAFKLLNKSNAQFTEVKRYRIDLPKDLNDVTQRLEAARLATPKGHRPVDVAAFVAAYATHPDVMRYNALNAENTTLRGRLEPGGAPVAHLTAFDTKVRPFYEDPSMGAITTDAKSIDLRIQDLELKKGALPARNADVERSRDVRIIQEEELIGKLDGILGESIADVLEERYDVMEERMGRLSTENQKKAEKDVQQMVLELKKKMNSNWIRYNPTTHKRDVRKDNIKRDVIHLGFTYDKDMALKQLIARDLFGLTHAQCEKLNVVTGEYVPARGATPARSLTEVQLAQVNKVFELTGQDYRDKLFADMLAGRSILDRSLNFGVGDVVPGWAKLGFRRNEWQKMMALYEPEITKGIEANAEAKAALRSLEAQGVKLDTNMKWLWYILAVVLGVGGGALGGAVAPSVLTGLKGAGAALVGHGTSRIVGEAAGAAAAGLGAKAVIDSQMEH